MPKAERGTVKDIANRMKSRGLQKLKWYCQMCEKQCRDENGFKCHTQSDSHLRQMKLFATNSTGMLDTFSKQFEQMYMETLRRRHGTSRVNANNVYQEVIHDKDHIHMNATKWVSLTEFVQYLGKTGKVVVDETERGWYVTYIERDATILARQEAQKRRVNADRIEEERFQKQMEIQRVEAAKAYERAMVGNNNDGGLSSLEGPKATHIGERNDNDETQKIKLSLVGNAAVGSTTSKKKQKKASIKSVFLEEEEDDDQDDDNKNKHNGSHKGTTSRWGQQDQNSTTTTTTTMSNVTPTSTSKETHHKTTNSSLQSSKRARESSSHHDEYNDDDITKEKKKRTTQHSDDIRKDYWLYRNIIVRIISKKLAKGKYYKHKAVVIKVLKHDKYSARVQVLDENHNEDNDGDILELDQDDLETVIPKETEETSLVRILNGPGRHEKAKILSLDKKRCVANLQLKNDENGRIIRNVDFADFAKICKW